MGSQERRLERLEADAERLRRQRNAPFESPQVIVQALLSRRDVRKMVGAFDEALYRAPNAPETVRLAEKLEKTIRETKERLRKEHEAKKRGETDGAP